MHNIHKLTEVELTIMKVLWDSEKGMTVQEIAEVLKKEKISNASISQAIRNMLKKGAVEVSEFVLVSNVYARCFKTCFGQKEYLAAEFCRLQKNVFGNKSKHTAGITAAFLGTAKKSDICEAEIEELQKIVNEKKEMLEKEKK